MPNKVNFRDSSILLHTEYIHVVALTGDHHVVIMYVRRGGLGSPAGTNGGMSKIHMLKEAGDTRTGNRVYAFYCCRVTGKKGLGRFPILARNGSQ